jgi:hypothetical protein
MEVGTENKSVGKIPTIHKLSILGEAQKPQMAHPNYRSALVLGTLVFHSDQ